MSACDHRIGAIGTEDVRSEQAVAAVRRLVLLVRSYNDLTGRYAITPPAQLSLHRYCPDCGEKLEDTTDWMNRIWEEADKSATRIGIDLYRKVQFLPIVRGPAPVVVDRFQVIRARFSPVDIHTLRPEAHEHIGEILDWEACWIVTEEDGGPYVGQWAMIATGRPNFGWVPLCDLEAIEEEKNDA
jgi:hypothetical protein